MLAFDLDGVVTPDFDFPPGSIVISGRTWSEYNDVAKAIAAKVPTYIRGSGWPHDANATIRFKVAMILQLGVTEYWESDAYQADQIRKRTHVTVHREQPPGNGAETGGCSRSVAMR
jgi:hypothetical protein